MDMDDLADGMALWQEHRPAGTREDWLRIARRWHEQGMAPPENPSPLFGALYDAVAITDEMVERAAIGLRNFEAYECQGMEPVDTLDNLLAPDYYRNQARAALAAALHWQLSSGGSPTADPIEPNNEGEN